MESAWIAGALALGVALGALVAWLILRARQAQALAERGSAGEREAAVTAERLAAREQELSALRADLERALTRAGELDGLAQRAHADLAATRAHSERVPGLEARVAERDRALAEARAALASSAAALEAERKAAAEKLALIEDAKAKLLDTFRALSADALKTNNSSFLELAKATLERFQSEAKGDLDARTKAVETLVLPIRESLVKVDAQVQELEKARREAYGALAEQVRALDTTGKDLRQETANLVKALRAPATRGRWGEMHLRRVVEMAGMQEHCDFVTQESVDTDDGRLRPDMIVRLAGGMQIVVDAKTPLQAYLEAHDAGDDATRASKLREHAAHLRAHLRALSQKVYWDQFERAPDFVFLFLPSEGIYQAALESDPRLIEDGVHQRVVFATPSTLITLLRVVAIGWRQQQLEESALEIAHLGKELYERMAKLGEHFGSVRKGLDQAVKAYNQLASSMEARVLPAARRFKELGVQTAQEIDVLEGIALAARALQAPELAETARALLPEGEEAPEPEPLAPPLAD